MESKTEEKRIYGACGYCGELIMADYTEDMTQEDRDNKATMMCRCLDARQAADKGLQADNAKQKVRELFGDYARERGLRPIEWEIVKLMDEAVELLGAELIWSITVDISAGGKAKISRTTKDKINVERVETQRYKLEG